LLIAPPLADSSLARLRCAGPCQSRSRAAARARAGTRVRVIGGLLSEQLGVLAALRPHERVLVLLRLLGGQRRVKLARNAIEAVE